MSTNQVLEIQSYVHRVFMAPEEENWCATFETDGNQDLWVQLLRGSVNAACPYDDDPLARLARHGIAAQVEEMIAFEANAYATLLIKWDSVSSVARFVHAWFSTILELRHDYTLVVHLEDLG